MPLWFLRVTNRFAGMHIRGLRLETVSAFRPTGDERVLHTCTVRCAIPHYYRRLETEERKAPPSVN